MGKDGFQYNACVVEGVHYILSKYDEGVSFEKIKRYALAPDGHGGTAWKFTPIFDFDHDEGFWKSVILPEIRQERQRQDILTLVAARVKPVPKKYIRNEDRAGGDEEMPKPSYPTGPNLTALGRKLGMAHRPLGKNGKILCFDFSAHAGCTKGDACNFSHLQRIKVDGLHWAVKFDLARRGGHLNEKRIDAPLVEGYVQALRSQNSANWKQSVDESKGAVGRRRLPIDRHNRRPPGLYMAWSDDAMRGTVQYEQGSCVSVTKSRGEESVDEQRIQNDLSGNQKTFHEDKILAEKVEKNGNPVFNGGKRSGRDVTYKEDRSTADSICTRAGK